jgi:hypothetical protein
VSIVGYTNARQRQPPAATDAGVLVENASSPLDPTRRLHLPGGEPSS